MKLRACLIVMLLAAWPVGASAALYTEDFETDQTANWTVNRSHDNAVAPSDANFFFDYSTMSIPSAPGSGGTTHGLRLRANRPGGTGNIFSGISVSPNGQSFSGSYKVEFDAWLNTIGPMPLGGAGSTQVTSWGIMTAGTSPQWAGGTQDSIHFGTTADGQSSVDYRAYSPAAPSGYLAPSGVFAAGTGTSPDARNDSNPYYAGIGGLTPPAGQGASQTGTTATGAAGFAWRHMVIEKAGSIVTWSMDGKLIVTVDSTGMTLGGGNLLFGQYDVNGTTTNATGDPLVFGLIDNVVVTPEPASMLLLGAGGLVLRLRRRR